MAQSKLERERGEFECFFSHLFSEDFAISIAHAKRLDNPDVIRTIIVNEEFLSGFFTEHSPRIFADLDNAYRIILNALIQPVNEWHPLFFNILQYVLSEQKILFTPPGEKAANLLKLLDYLIKAYQQIGAAPSKSGSSELYNDIEKISSFSVQHNLLQGILVFAKLVFAPKLFKRRFDSCLMHSLSYPYLNLTQEIFSQRIYTQDEIGCIFDTACEQENKDAISFTLSQIPGGFESPFYRHRLYLMYWPGHLKSLETLSFLLENTSPEIRTETLVRNDFGFGSWFTLACAESSADVVRLIMSYLTIEQLNQVLPHMNLRGNSALVEACIRGDDALTTEMLQKAQGNTLFSIIEFECHKVKFNIVDKLLCLMTGQQRKAIFSARNEKGLFLLDSTIDSFESFGRFRRNRIGQDRPHGNFRQLLDHMRPEQIICSLTPTHTMEDYRERKEHRIIFSKTRLNRLLLVASNKNHAHLVFIFLTLMVNNDHRKKAFLFVCKSGDGLAIQNLFQIIFKFPDYMNGKCGYQEKKAAFKVFLETLQKFPEQLNKVIASTWFMHFYTDACISKDPVGVSMLLALMSGKQIRSIITVNMKTMDRIALLQTVDFLLKCVEPYPWDQEKEPLSSMENEALANIKRILDSQADIMMKALKLRSVAAAIAQHGIFPTITTTADPTITEAPQQLAVSASFV